MDLWFYAREETGEPLGCSRQSAIYLVGEQRLMEPEEL